MIARVEDSEIHEQVRQAEALAPGRRSVDPSAGGGSQAGADQPRSLAQPVSTATSAAADLRRHGGALSSGARAVGSSACAVRASQGAARRAEDHVVEHADSSRRSTASSASASSIRVASRARTHRSSRWSTSVPFAWSRTSSSVTCGGCRQARSRTSRSMPSPERSSRDASAAWLRSSIRRRAQRKSKSKCRTAAIGSSPACTRA